MGQGHSNSGSDTDSDTEQQPAQSQAAGEFTQQTLPPAKPREGKSGDSNSEGDSAQPREPPTPADQGAQYPATGEPATQNTELGSDNAHEGADTQPAHSPARSATPLQDEAPEPARSSPRQIQREPAATPYHDASTPHSLYGSSPAGTQKSSSLDLYSAPDAHNTTASPTRYTLGEGQQGDSPQQILPMDTEFDGETSRLMSEIDNEALSSEPGPAHSNTISMRLLTDDRHDAQNLQKTPPTSPNPQKARENIGKTPARPAKLRRQDAAARPQLLDLAAPVRDATARTSENAPDSAAPAEKLPPPTPQPSERGKSMFDGYTSLTELMQDFEAEDRMGLHPEITDEIMTDPNDVTVLDISADSENTPPRRYGSDTDSTIRHTDSDSGPEPKRARRSPEYPASPLDEDPDWYTAFTTNRPKGKAWEAIDIAFQNIISESHRMRHRRRRHRDAIYDLQQNAKHLLRENKAVETRMAAAARVAVKHTITSIKPQLMDEAAKTAAQQVRDTQNEIENRCFENSESLTRNFLRKHGKDTDAKLKKTRDEINAFSQTKQ